MQTGGVLTPMLVNTVPQEAIDVIAAYVSRRHMAQPREVSRLVLFLASDESSCVTDAEQMIDGGQAAD